jgi:hypothetical protein
MAEVSNECENDCGVRHDAGLRHCHSLKQSSLLYQGIDSFMKNFDMLIEKPLAGESTCKMRNYWQSPHNA